MWSGVGIYSGGQAGVVNQALIRVRVISPCLCRGFSPKCGVRCVITGV